MSQFEYYQRQAGVEDFEHRNGAYQIRMMKR